MKYPKLKNTFICRILPYVIMLCVFALSILIVISIPPIPLLVKGLILLAIVIGLLVYYLKNLDLLFTVDESLVMLEYYNKARKQYDLQKNFDPKDVKKRMLKFGKGYDPIAIKPLPVSLRYKFCTSIAGYAKGIEKVIVVYDVDLLDKNTYREIFHSATVNSNSLIEKKKAWILSSDQKDFPLNRVTVIMIFAKRVDSSFEKNLFETVCKQEGDGEDISVLPCVINIEKGNYVFNSMFVCGLGLGIPVKNRGIRLIGKYMAGGRLPLKNNPHMLEPLEDIDGEQSYWSFLSQQRKGIILEDKQEKQRFESMTHGSVFLEDEIIYVRWEDRGVWVLVDLDEEKKLAVVDSIESWNYPKSNLIAKKTKAEIEKLIKDYFVRHGYSCKFLSD